MIDIAIIEKQVLSLNFQERSRLASVLIRSLDESRDELQPAEWERLWAKECQRRVAEMESGEVEGILGEVVFERLRRRLEERR